MASRWNRWQTRTWLLHRRVAGSTAHHRTGGTIEDRLKIDKNSVCHQYKKENYCMRILAQLNVPGTVITGAPPPAGIDIPPGSQHGVCIVGRHSSNAGVQTGAHGCMFFAGEQPQGVVFWKHEGAFIPPAPPKQLVHPGAAIRPDRRTAPHINLFTRVTFIIVVITTSPGAGARWSLFKSRAGVHASEAVKSATNKP